MTKLQMHLNSLGACEGAREFAGIQTAAHAWETCPRPDWLLWWASQTERNKKENLVRCAAIAARRVLHLIPAGEERPRLAIEAAELYANNPTRENAAKAKAAARAAWAAAWAAKAAKAERAAWAAEAAAEEAELCDEIRKILILPWTEDDNLFCYQS